MDDLGANAITEGRTPLSKAEAALATVSHHYGGQMDDLAVDDLGDAAHQQVADLIADMLHLVDVAGEDWRAALGAAEHHFTCEREDS